MCVNMWTWNSEVWLENKIRKVIGIEMIMNFVGAAGII